MSTKNTHNTLQSQMIEECATSQCVSTYCKTGVSMIYKDGKIIHTNDTYKGTPFFRKEFYYSTPPTVKELRTANAETIIVNILINNPHLNIVTYYDINKNYLDMEKLDTDTNLDPIKVIETMKNVKDFLQCLGIMYIDWKNDNIGISKDGTYKLFDFDASGLVDLNTNEWIVKPVEYWSYNKAINSGCKTHCQIDNFSFDYNIVGIKKL